MNSTWAFLTSHTRPENKTTPDPHLVCLGLSDLDMHGPVIKPAVCGCREMDARDEKSTTEEPADLSLSSNGPLVIPR